MTERWADREALVIVEPAGAARTYQYKLKYRWIVLLVLVFALSAGVFWFGLVVFGRTVSQARKASALATENDSLRAEFARLASLEAELDRLFQANERVLRLAGVEPESTLALPGDGRGPVPGHPWRFSRPSLAPRSGILSRGFVGGGEARHPGVDVPGPLGAPIVAAGGGIVREVTEDPVYGNLIRIDHGDDVESLYGHNQTVHVQEGDSVAAGDLIARLGNTGRSSAPHLHFEVRIDGEPVDPGLYIREYGITDP